MKAISFHRFGTSICAFIVPFAAIFALGQSVPAERARLPLGGRGHSLPATGAGAISPAIVIGFVGGFIRHDDPVHSEVQLAARLRKAYPSGVNVQTFESYRGEDARKKS